MVDVDRVVARVNRAIAARPERVVVAFLLATVVFGFGLGAVDTSSGTQQFTEDVPAQRAFEDVLREFGPSRAADTGSTQLIQEGGNVLAKPALLRMLRAQERLAEHPPLRVTATSSPAQVVARELDPSATTLREQIRAVERASPSEIDAAVDRAAANPAFASAVSDDFNREAATASAAIGSVTHRVPGSGDGAPAGTGGESPMTRIQGRSATVVEPVAPDITVFGTGIVSGEFSAVILDSLLIVVPAALVLIVAFLVIAYRDPLDLALGMAALGMTLVWTFGFMGLVGIAFTQMLIAVPPLLLAVGIDFGIHAVNRYREERVAGRESDAAMTRTTDQLLVAFFIVTGTTVIGFGANLTSGLSPIREFGVVASVGIVFTFLIFGVFLPAAKLLLDRWRARVGFPSFSTRPLGAEDSLLGRVLPVGVHVARLGAIPFLLAVLLLTAGAAHYATGVDTSFQQEDFLPPAETPEYLDRLPEPFAPSEYSVTATLDTLDRHFATGGRDTVTVYVEGHLESPAALESIERASKDPPPTVLREGRTARRTSIVTVIEDYAAVSPSFARLVDRRDRDDDGVPDSDLESVYDALLDSPFRGRALQYLSPDRRSTRVVYRVEGDVRQSAVTADGRALAERFRFDATATGSTVVFQAVSDVIFRSAITSLSLALVLTAGFLVSIYGLLEGRATLGIVNLVPIVVTVGLLAGSMRALDIPLNALTATILSITIGLGIDYSVHVTHRFADEYAAGKGTGPALLETVRGTGGALTGSMLTTVGGMGVLVLAITPILGQFGILTGLSIVYSYLSSVLVTPAAVVAWARLGGG